jgi:hypothetical protein
MRRGTEVLEHEEYPEGYLGLQVLEYTTWEASAARQSFTF